MNEHLKQRLVGAIVLFALAVIFIPMLLDGDDSRIPMFGSNVPPKPDYEFETLDIPLDVPLDIKPVESVVVEHTQDVGRLKSAPVAVTPKSSTKVSSVSKSSLSPKKEPSASVPAKTGPVTWVIQVGSFTEANNAFTLRDTLRKKGFAAFVEEVHKDKGLVYRVRIGPELTEDKANKVKEELKANLKLDGLVVRHP